MKVKSLSRVRLLATPWTAAHQAPPSMGFSRQRVLEWGAIAFFSFRRVQTKRLILSGNSECPGERKLDSSLNEIKPNTIYQRRQWHPTPVLLPGKSHGWRSLVGCSPWGREESDTTERLHFHFSLSCIGEGNGNPLQCSCLENPRDGGAWWLPSMGSHRVGHD